MREPWIRKKIRRRFDFKRLVLTRRYFVQNLQDEINAYPELLKFGELLPSSDLNWGEWIFKFRKFNLFMMNPLSSSIIRIGPFII